VEGLGSYGINYIDDARDEYQMYLPSIFSLKIYGASIEELAQRLYEFETKRMELYGGKERCERVAEKIFNL
jgi:hypothetical protein